MLQSRSIKRRPYGGKKNHTFASETWIQHKREENGITAAEVKCMRRTSDYTRWILK
jgi:hypothetical protein